MATLSTVKEAFDNLVTSIIMSMPDIEPGPNTMVRIMDTYFHENEGGEKKNWYNLNYDDEVEELAERLGPVALLSIGANKDNEYSGDVFVFVEPNTNQWRIVYEEEVYDLFSERMRDYVEDVLKKPHLEGYAAYYDFIEA